MLAGVLATVEQVPEFGALIFGVPLTEVIAVREKALLGTGFLFIASTATETGIVLMLFDGIEQSDRLQLIARGIRAFFLDHATGIDRFLDRSDHQARADFFDKFIAIGHGLVEIVAGIHVDQGERHFGGPERLAGEPSHDNRVLAT